MSTDLNRLSARSLPVGYGRYEGSRYKVVEEIRRAQRRGEIRRVIKMELINPATGTVSATVELKDPAPRWRKPVIIASTAVAVLAGVGWLGYIVAAATASIVESSGPVILGFVLFGGLVLVLGGTVGGGRIIEGTFRARIK